jgi:hypothetical protein
MAKGDYQQLAAEGRFGDNVIDTVVLGDDIYIIAADNLLYWFNREADEFEQLGDDAWDPRILLAAGDTLICLEEDGSVYAIDPEDGSAQLLGDEGDWAEASCAAIAGNRLVIAGSDGSISAVDLESGEFVVLAEDGWAPANMFNSDSDYVHVLEANGTIYVLNVENGESSQVGKDEWWAGTTASDGKNGALYLLNDGKLYALDTWAPDYTQIGESPNWRSTMLFIGDSGLYTFEENGSAYLVEVLGGHRVRGARTAMGGVQPECFREHSGLRLRSYRWLARTAIQVGGADSLMRAGTMVDGTKRESPQGTLSV